MFLVDSDNLHFLLKNWEENGLRLHGVMSVHRPISMAVQIAQLLCSFIERALTFIVVLTNPEIPNKKLDHSLRGLYGKVPDAMTFQRDSNLTREIPLKSVLNQLKIGTKPSPEDYLDLHSVNLRYETEAVYKVEINRSELVELRDKLQYLILTLIVNYQTFLGKEGKIAYREMIDRGHYLSTWFEAVSGNLFEDLPKADTFTIKSEPFA